MKKFLVILLSLGLIVAFGATASAADVKFGGSYYLVGVYDSNSSLAASDAAYSRAYFYQRVRLQPVFKIAEGLTFTARMDAMEKQWGQTDWRRGGVGDDTTSSRPNGTVQKIQESFEFERGYVTFMTGVGQFDVGYQAAATWGTVFADSGTTKPRIKFSTKAGPVALVAIYEKAFEADTSSVAGYPGKADADNDNFYLAAVYGFKGGNTGLLYGYINQRANRLAATPFRTKLHLLAPYAKANFGPVYVEGEVNYWFGKVAEFENGPPTDVKRDGWSAYLLAKANMGPANFGAQVGWSSGWDGTGDTNKAGGGGGADWNPALILMNDNLATWSGGGTNVSNSSKGGNEGLLLYNIFGGFKVTKALDLGVALTFAQKDKVVANRDKELGMEFDVTATYKLYDNLSYMVGAGYLWTGDYFKGVGGTGTVGNDYILLNKLSLSF